MPKVSVIIPIYGVEKYIERCARSLFEQTLDDIEYIFVNDCSPDHSIEILKSVIDDYPDRKSQVKILNHDKNKGLPITRQTGLKIATGEYIIHCDSDDWVDTNMYRDMYEKAKQEDADVVVCDFMATDDNGNNRRVKACRCKDKDKYIENFLYKRDSYAVWNKMYKKEISLRDDYVYPQGAQGEDLVMTLQKMYHCNKISYIEKPYYYYFKNPKSMTRLPNKDSIIKRFNQSVSNSSIILDFCKRKGIYEEYRYGIDIVLYDMKNYLRPLLIEKKYYLLWLNTFPETNYRILWNPSVHITVKLRHILTLLRIIRH